MTPEEQLSLIRQEKARRQASINPQGFPEGLDNAAQLALIRQELARRRGETPEALQDSSMGGMAKKMGRKAVEAVRAMGTGTGGYLDLINLITKATAGELGNAMFGENGEALRDALIKISRPEIAEQIRNSPWPPQEEKPLAQVFPGAIDKLYGEDLSPKNATDKAWQGTFEILSPTPGLPGGGSLVKAAKSGAKPLLKYLGKQVAGAGGASSAIHLTPRMTEEGTVDGIAEDILKGVAGGSLATSAPGIAKGAAQAVRHPIESPQNVAAKLTSKLLTPNQELLKTAEKHGIELPIHTATEGTKIKSIANNILRSRYASQDYTDFLKGVDESLMEAVKKSVNTLGTENITPQVASQLLRDNLRVQEKFFKKQADNLYSEARELSTKKDIVQPVETIKALKSKPVKSLKSNISPSSSQKSVINRIGEISSKLIKKEKKSAIPEQISNKYKDDPKMLSILEKYYEATKNGETNVKKGKKGIHVNKLIDLRSSLLDSLEYENDIRGSKAYLSKLVKTLDNDIHTLKNKEFLDKWDEARGFFKGEIGKRLFRDKFGRKLIRENGPVDAYNMMNSVDNITNLEKMVGSNKDGVKYLNDLKKAKLMDLLSSSIEGDLKKEGAPRMAAYAKLFQKGAKKNDLLRKLVGDKEYRSLSEIAEITHEFSKSNRVLLNTSGTHHAALDTKRERTLGKAVMETLGWMMGGAAFPTFPITTTATAAGLMGYPYVISKLFSNPEFIRKARNYALARKQGREKDAINILNKMLKIGVASFSESEQE